MKRENIGSTFNSLSETQKAGALLAAGADVQETAALVKATSPVPAGNGHVDTVRKLIAAGANPK